MVQPDISIYQRNLMPDFIGSYMRGRSFGQMLNQEQKQDDIREVMQSSVQTLPDGSLALNQKMALSGLAKVDPDTYFKYKQVLETGEQNRQSNLLATAKSGLRPVKNEAGQVTGYEPDPNNPNYNKLVSESLNLGRLREMQNKGLLGREKFGLEKQKFGLDEKKFAGNQVTKREGLIASQAAKGFLPVYGKDGKSIKSWKRSPRGKNNLGRQTEASKVIDRTFGKDYAKWTGGGFSNVQTNINKLDGIIDELKGTDSATGGLIGMIPSGALDYLAPKAADLRDRVENVVMQSLKEILGGQFSEKEGLKLVRSSYNTKLDEKTNIKRLKSTVIQLKSMAEAKNRMGAYYEGKGTIQGFKGSQFTKLLDPKGETEHKARRFKGSDIKWK